MAWCSRMLPCLMLLLWHSTQGVAALKVCSVRNSGINMIRINLDVPPDAQVHYLWSSTKVLQYMVHSVPFPRTQTKALDIRHVSTVLDDLGGRWYPFPSENLLLDYCKMLVQNSGDPEKTLWSCTNLQELYVTFPKDVVVGRNCEAKPNIKVFDFRIPTLCTALFLVLSFGLCRVALICGSKCRGRRSTVEDVERTTGAVGAELDLKPATRAPTNDLPPSYDDVMSEGAAPPPYTSLKLQPCPSGRSSPEGSPPRTTCPPAKNPPVDTNSESSSNSSPSRPSSANSTPIASSSLSDSSANLSSANSHTQSTSSSANSTVPDPLRHHRSASISSSERYSYDNPSYIEPESTDPPITNPTGGISSPPSPNSDPSGNNSSITNPNPSTVNTSDSHSSNSDSDNISKPNPINVTRSSTNPVNTDSPGTNPPKPEQ